MKLVHLLVRSEKSVTVGRMGADLDMKNCLRIGSRKISSVTESAAINLGKQRAETKDFFFFSLSLFL